MQNHLEISSKSQFWIRNVEVRRKHKENIPFLKYIFMNNIFFCLQTTFFDGFNVFLSFLAEKCYRTIMNSPQKASFGTNMCIILTKSYIYHPALSNNLQISFVCLHLVSFLLSLQAFIIQVHSENTGGSTKMIMPCKE